MGLDPGAVAGVLRQFEADALVCGHVHWGQRFTLDVDGLARDVVVLGAWEETGSYAVVRGGEVGFYEFR